MRLIDRNDLERWAQRYDSKGNLPVLISRLILATNSTITFIEFPGGSATSIEGWDGIAICDQGSPFVPEGKTLWEFGMQENVKGKADEDYEKRTKDALGHSAAESIFIFVTPRYWKKKEKWVESKKKDGIWKDVVVYDSVNLEEWLDTARAVSRWFAGYVSKYASDGIVTIEEFWKEWARGPKGELPVECVISGRETESAQLAHFLSEPPKNIRGVKASSKDEAIAFIVASATQFESHAKERFFSKSLIVDTSPNFRSIRINTSSLNLIAKFDEASILFAAVSEGHHVLVPVGPDDEFPHETINLPLIDRDGQISSLMSLGLSREEAARLSRESGRNITVLKRLLGHFVKLEWAKDERARELLPALLVGRWEEQTVGDRQLLELLSGLSFDDYMRKLTFWRDRENAPIIQIGTAWRLTSPLDAWTHLSSHLTQEDIKTFRAAIGQALGNGNPNVEVSGNKTIAPLLTPKKTYSDWSREGLVQSLILLALYGDGLRISSLISPQRWVDDIVSSLLNGDGTQLVSLNKEMPLLAEASPASFLDAINKSLDSESKAVMQMFQEQPALLGPISNHTGLLWALEGLAWDSNYLTDVAKILAKLTTLDPGGSISNRPLNSLVEIFKPWHHQTFANLDDRLLALQSVVQVDNGVAWNLLMKLLPDQLGVGQNTHRMRWRLFDKSFDSVYTFEEEFDMHESIIEILFSIFDNSEERLAQILEKSSHMIGTNRSKILQFAKGSFSHVVLDRYLPWHIVRKILAHHRSVPEATWSMSEEELKPYQELYKLFEPKDVVKKNIWLFNENWPEFPEGLTEEEELSDEGSDRHLKRVEQERVSAMRQILTATSFQKVIELSQEVAEPIAFGDTLARLINDGEELKQILTLSSTPNGVRLIESFFFRKSITNGLPWITSFYEEMRKRGFTNPDLAHIFIPLLASSELWNYLDGVDEDLQVKYWTSIYPRFLGLPEKEIERGIKYLLSFKRFVTAIDTASFAVHQLPTELVVEMLTKAVTEKASEERKLRGHEVSRLFMELDKRSDLNQTDLIQLEWFYLPILSSYGTQRKPKILHDELAEKPDFFVNVLQWVYKPKREDIIEKERNDIPSEILQQRANHGYQLLQTWKKIPGVDENGFIDRQKLQNWVRTAREMAAEIDRIDVADMHLGQILAQYPERKIDLWPPTEISEVIEAINTESLVKNFGAAASNKRGSSTRGVFDGGNIERAHAAFFNKMADKHKQLHPVTASILKQLAQKFEYDAKLMDEQAEQSKLDA